MIIEAQIINQPYSGEYQEIIYDKESAWNSQNWTFIKFTNDDNSEWCGQFRGYPIQVALSVKHFVVLVLTSDYLFQLDLGSGRLMESEDQPTYENLTSAPNGDFIIADSYKIEKVTTSIKHKDQIKSPIRMDLIKFKKWENSKLEFTCDEFLNWDRHYTMVYDSDRNKIEIINK